jgi:DNA-binding winged helix-turn-helix (wHTH) protein
MPESIAACRVRFGMFEADLRASELRKHGLRVRLHEQPFQVLALLLARPGQIVTRDELRTRLWTADTFVDFDHGLNKAINRSEALGDSATSPRLVETVARRGYRFIGDWPLLMVLMPSSRPRYHSHRDVRLGGLRRSSAASR